jgi:hypothetical protein
MRSNLLLASVIFFVTLLTFAQDFRKDGHLLQITSPVNGTVVNPGQTLSVTVTSPPNTAFSQVAVIGEPISLAAIATSTPAQFSISIPTKISCRRYTLVAVGITSSGQDVESPEALIDVERPDLPTSLYTQMPAIEFDNLGETLPVTISANFSDGSTFEVTESSKLVYNSSNTDVATVNATGMVMASGVGKATIIATYGSNIHITIPIIVPPQALDPSASSLNFDSQTVGISSSPKQISLTNKTYAPMEISGLSITGDFSENDNCRSLSPLAAGSTCMINVTFTPTEVGPCEGSVSISDDFSGTLTLRLSGTGKAAPNQHSRTNTSTSFRRCR